MTLPQLYNRAERQGIVIDDFPAREVVSASFPEGWILLNKKRIKNSADEKSHIAHELGHIETGSFYNVHAKLDIRGKHERRADEAAIKMLVPRVKLRRAVKQNMVEVWELAEYFEVSCEFMERAIIYYQQEDQACDL